jgi:hyperosmotically inducible periplasmic protein
MRTKILMGILALGLAAPLAFSQQSSMSSQRDISQRGVARIQEEVRHQLVMLPYLTLFDNLQYKVDDNGTVTLLGAVTNPTLKNDAQNVVKRIEGVERVDNQIEVLPASPMDDQIRRAEYRAIYGSDGFIKYAMESLPPIHIVVKNGHVDLEGMVDNQGDKNLAEIRAKGVPGVFDVKDNLKVENSTNARK